jgi:hypothetical protein
MVNFRLIERPAFEVIGRKTWIGGQDNELFGRFWQECLVKAPAQPVAPGNRERCARG